MPQIPGCWQTGSDPIHGRRAMVARSRSVRVLLKITCSSSCSCSSKLLHTHHTTTSNCQACPNRRPMGTWVTRDQQQQQQLRAGVRFQKEMRLLSLEIREPDAPGYQNLMRQNPKLSRCRATKFGRRLRCGRISRKVSRTTRTRTDWDGFGAREDVSRDQSARL